jgi:tetratricopeptide (TPR) repeat protein/DNA-binding SARP family transcriptional activator
MWWIRLMGGMAVQWHDDDPVTLDAGKVAWPIAYLAFYVTNRHKRTTLAHLAWQDADLDRAQRYLSDAVYRFKRQLRDTGVPDRHVAALFATKNADDGIGLNAAVVQTDVATFEHRVRRPEGIVNPTARAQDLQKAVERYAPLLPGFEHVREADGSWIVKERARLEQKNTQAIDELIGLLDSIQDPDVLRASAEAVFTKRPTCKRAVEVLVAEYQRVGRSEDAEQVAAQFRYHQDPHSAASGSVSEASPAPRLRASVMQDVPPLTPLYVEHQGAVAAIERTFRGLDATIQSRVVVVSGMHGAGKTQAAIAYAHRTRAVYHHIFWLGAGSDELLSQGITQMAGRLSLEPEPEWRLTRAAVFQWLRNHAGWLLVVDNLMLDAAVAEFQEVATAGHVLITTVRRPDGHLAGIKLGEMSADEGATLLLRSVVPEADLTALQQVPGGDWAKAREISDGLGGLPLAISQAGAYINAGFAELHNYLDRREVARNRCLREYPGFESGRHPSVFLTFSMALERVEGRATGSPTDDSDAKFVADVNRGLADLLRLSAFLAPDAIPVDLIAQPSIALGPNLQPLALDKIMRDHAVAEAWGWSLIQLDRRHGSFSVHVIVQEVIRARLSADEQIAWASRATRLMAHVFPAPSYSEGALFDWSACERLLPHVHACGSCIVEYDLAFREAGQLLLNAGTYAWHRAKYDLAEGQLLQAVSIFRRAKDARAVDLARGLQALADCLRHNADFPRAVAAYEEALDIWERQEQPGFDMTRCLHGLGLQYRDWLHYGEANQTFKRALEVRTKLLGEAHFQVLWLQNDLADLYCRLGMCSKGEPLLLRALELVDPANDKHREMISWLNSTLGIYCRRSEFETTRDRMQAGLDLAMMKYGPLHPQVAGRLYDMAMLFRHNDQHVDAEDLFQKAVRIWQETLGEHSTDIVLAYNGLAWLYIRQDRFQEAEALMQLALVAREATFDTQHPYRALSLANIAVLYQHQDRSSEAEPLFVEATSILQNTAGPNNPVTAAILVRQAAMMRKASKPREARTLEQQAEQMRRSYVVDWPDLAELVEAAKADELLCNLLGA